MTILRSRYKYGNLTFREKTYSPAEGVSLWERAPMLAAISDPSSFQNFFDDFYLFDGTATVGGYVTVADVGETQGVINGAGGQLSIACDGDDNDEAYVRNQVKAWLFATSKPLWFEARIKLTEAATDDANFIVGLSDTVGANSLLDNGGGPMASYDGAVLFKVDGGTVFQFESSNAGTQVTTTNAGAFVTNTWYRLGFVFDPVAATITPWLDGVAGTSQAVTLAGLEAMHIIFGTKAGGINTETLIVDWVRVLQAR